MCNIAFRCARSNFDARDLTSMMWETELRCTCVFINNG